MVFRQRQALRLAIDGCGRAENQRGDIAALHGCKKAVGTNDVVVVVKKRFFNGLANRLQPGEMNDGLTLVLPQGRFDGRLVTNIALHQNWLTPCDLLDPVECFRVTVTEVVENDNFVAGPKEFDAGVGSDVTGTARYKDANTRPPAWAADSMATAVCVFASKPESLPAKHAKFLPVATFLS